MRRLFTISLMATALVVVTAPLASASDGFTIPINTLVKAAPGSLTVLAEVATPEDHVGDICVGVAVAANGRSVHPGNDLIIESGGTSATLEDVEETADKVTTAMGAITLGATVKVTLDMGNSGVFSGGLLVAFDGKCTPPPAPNIQIEKAHVAEQYVGNSAQWTIKVTNPGPVDLVDVNVTDDLAALLDPGSDCVRFIGDLAVDGVVEYECTISGLDGASIYDNTATVVGTGPNGTQVTASASSSVFPLQDTVVTTTVAPATTVAPTTTHAPGTTSAPGETLPVTGIDGAQAQGFGIAGLVLLLVGIVLLGGSAVIGQRKSNG